MLFFEMKKAPGLPLIGVLDMMRATNKAYGMAHVLVPTRIWLMCIIMEAMKNLPHIINKEEYGQVVLLQVQETNK
jgi:hypothetical protein